MLILRCKYQIYCSCWSHIDIIYSEPTTLEFPFTGSLVRKGQNPKSQSICEKVASSPSPRPLEDRCSVGGHLSISSYKTKVIF